MPRNNVWAGDAWSKETRRVSLLFLHPEHSRVASHVQEGIEAGETASPLTNWPSPRRAQHPAKEAAASKSRSAFYRFEIRSPEGGLSPPAISRDESREPSC
jgi:hypothetical protein